MSVEVDRPLESRQRRSRAPLIGVVLLGLVAVATLVYFGNQGSRPLDEQELVADTVAAWFGGDVAEARRLLLSVPAARGIDIPDDEIRYQGAIGAQARIVSCHKVGSLLACDMSYSNDLNEAIDRHPIVVPVSFEVNEGRVAVISTNFNRDDYPLDPEIDGSFANFMLIEGLAIEYNDVCYATPVRDVACADFQLEHLDDWAKWRLAQQ
jgi:hypothetical protein